MIAGIEFTLYKFLQSPPLNESKKMKQHAVKYNIPSMYINCKNTIYLPLDLMGTISQIKT